jgi:hypothetical protein
MLKVEESLQALNSKVVLANANFFTRAVKISASVRSNEMGLRHVMDISNNAGHQFFDRHQTHKMTYTQ